MKKIIAAALSVLVGAFGYNIVDKALEDRVTSLESEVVELREEVSRYHPQYSEYDTTKSDTTVNNYSTTKKSPASTNNNIDPSQPLAIGSYLTESTDSLNKFLIREYSSGNFRYIPHYNYEPTSIATQPISTTKPTTTQPTTTKLDFIEYTTSDDEPQPFNTTGINDDPVDTFVSTTSMLDGIIGGLPTQTLAFTTNNAPVAEYYINITESSAQITNITEDVSYKYSYDKDYSSVSKPITQKTTFVTVLCKGYTDPALSGKKVILTVVNSYYGTYVPKEIISNTINADGSFEYKAVYSTTSSVRGIDEYSFTSIKLS